MEKDLENFNYLSKKKYADIDKDLEELENEICESKGKKDHNMSGDCNIVLFNQ